MKMKYVWAMHMARKEFDQAVREKLGGEFECWDWWELLGLAKEPQMRKVKEKTIVGRDGVHSRIQ
jgi:hypothetical protein